MGVISQPILIAHEVVPQIQQMSSKALDSFCAGRGDLIRDLSGRYENAVHPSDRLDPLTVPHLVSHSWEFLSDHGCEVRVYRFDDGRRLCSHLLEGPEPHTDMKPVKDGARRVIGSSLHQAG